VQAGLVASLAFFAAASVTPATKSREDVQMGGARLLKLPLAFEPNAGQLPSGVRFLARTELLILALEEDRVVLHYVDPVPEGAKGEHAGLSRTHGRAKLGSLSLRLVGGRLRAPVGVDELPGATHYVGNPRGAQHGIPRLARVIYQDVYPGIDLVFHQANGTLEYDFELAPGSDPSVIEIEFDGAVYQRIDALGALVVSTSSGGRLRHGVPRLEQGTGGGPRTSVAGGWSLRGKRAGFRVGAYDKQKRLRIDPTVVYETTTGSGSNLSEGVARDGQGNLYLGGFMSALSGTPRSFVAKFTADGTFQYQAFFGGFAVGIQNLAVDAQGHIYLAGAASGDLTPVNAFQATVSPEVTASGEVAFLARLSPALNVEYATYFGGSIRAPSGDTIDDNALSVAVDNSGGAYIAGWSQSGDFPTSAGAFQRSSVSYLSAFAAKFDTNASGAGSLVYSTLLGSPDSITQANSIAIDSMGAAYVTGFSAAPTGSLFPTRNGFQIVPASVQDEAFLVKLDPARTGDESLLYSTLLGGTGSESVTGVAVDLGARAYVTGFTTSSDFPATTGLPHPHPPDPAVFVAKVDPALSGAASRIWATHFGLGWRSNIAVDSAGSTYVTGDLVVDDFPTVNPISPNNGFAFLFKLNGNGGADYSTRLGDRALTPGKIHADGVAIDEASDTAYVAGQKGSPSVLFLTAVRGDVVPPITVLTSTTRWKPQRDTTQNVDIKFSSVSPLKSAAVTITGPSLVAPIQATFDPANPPSPYVITWAGPWTTNPSDPSSYLAAGDYKLVIQGVKADDSTIESTPTDPNSTVSLVEVMQVELLPADDDPRPNPLTANPALPPLDGQQPPQGRPGEGKRIFAEGVTPTGPIFNRVKVRATVFPVISDLRDEPAVKVFVRSVDVDDPAWSVPSEPNSADKDFDSQPLDVADNRGEPGQGTIADSELEIPQGQTAVTTVLQTSLQPGDNYRVMASTSAAWRDDLRAYQPSPAGEIRHYSNGATLTQDERNSVSDMLTVWRTLHLEVDSMSAPPANPNDAERNFLRGSVAYFTVNGEPEPGNPPEDPPWPYAAVLVPDETVPPLGLADGSPDLTTGQKGRFERGTLCIGTIREPPIQPTGECAAPAITIRPLVANGPDRVELGDTTAIPCTLQAPDGSTASTAAMLWDGTRFRVSGRLPSTFAGGNFDLGGVHFQIRSVYSEGPTPPPPTTTYIDVEPGPELRFHLVDDDAVTHPFSVSSRLITDCQGNVDCEADPSRNLFAQAYVTVKYDLPSVQALASFQRNVPDATAAYKDQLARGRDLTTLSSLGYWAGYIQGAFQGDALADGDPDAEGALGVIQGATPDLVDTFGSLLFVEGIRDFSAILDTSCPFDLNLTESMAHELGHQFGLRHAEGAIMSQACNVPHFFEAYSLSAIRNRRDPQ
jgi:hypothetical protein